MLSLARIREREIDIAQAHGEVKREIPDKRATSIVGLVRQRSLLIFAGAMMLFQLANAAMLPLMAGVVTTRSSQWAPVLIAACIIVPQAIVALCSPSVGRKAQAWGRRPLLLIAFASLVIRGLLFATVRDPYLLVMVQIFDGITAAIFSVMVPLIVADVAFGSGHFKPGAGHCRNRGRHRRVAQHGARRLCQRQARQQHRLHGPGRRRRARAVHDLAGDAGDAAEGMTQAGLAPRRPSSCMRRHI
ncbi:hypothetical protein ACVWY2_009198 [Bradyrhizobium sp. JR6.1]